MTGVPELFLSYPTAVQRIDEEQDTPLSSLSVAPVGLGVDWRSHSVPFQRSASVTYVPELFLSSPTAMQAVDEEHDIPTRTFVVAPLGLGVDWTAHSVPFQRSARVTSAPELLIYSPTAVQAVDEEQDTAPNQLYVAPVGLATDWIDHSVPFQRSASAA